MTSIVTHVLKVSRLRCANLLIWHSVNEHPSATHNDTVRPSSAATTPRATSLLTAMDVSVPPTDVSMRSVTDDAPSDHDVSMRSAFSQATVIKEEPDNEETDTEEEEIFPSIPIQEHAKACEGFSKGETTLGLPQRIYHEWNNAPYDNEWMKTAGVSDSILDEFVSRAKMDSLVLKGALKMGDELYMIIKYTHETVGLVVEKMARVSPHFPVPVSFGVVLNETYN